MQNLKDSRNEGLNDNLSESLNDSKSESLLETINQPRDLRRLTVFELERLANEIRTLIIETVGENGGHLASNLGVVEITIALHRAMNCPIDKLVLDVGHQCYTHKIITGRREAFKTLRQDGGMSGFPKPSESAYDCFGVGHASTSVSAAVGMARARDIMGEKYKVAALIGDGALTGGMAYEAICDAGIMKSQLLVILNDNRMSISRNVGALDRHLTRLRLSRKWRGAKRFVRISLDSIPFIGRRLSRGVEWVKDKARSLIVNGSFFESLGFMYVGPIDGHNLETLLPAVSAALNATGPTLLHIVTHKGKGLMSAEHSPEKYHGMPPSVASCDDEDLTPDAQSCSKAVGEAVTRLAASDKRVCAITAAMPTGTGLDAFKAEFRQRFADVGIAEEHAVTMAAGMAACGMKPIVAIYSTFLQRSIDQIIHDVCLPNLPVTFLIDHAGFVPCDGATHQGIFDLPLLRSIPNLTIYTPSDIGELKYIIERSRDFNAPTAIRFPKSLPPGSLDSADSSDSLVNDERKVNFEEWDFDMLGGDVAILAFGAMLPVAMKCSILLASEGVMASVVRVTRVKPLDTRMMERLSRVAVVALDEGQVSGGFCSAIAEYRAKHMEPPPLMLGIDDKFVYDHTVERLRESCGLTPERVKKRVLDFVKNSVNASAKNDER